MYNCNICGEEAIVDHVNPVKLTCNCEGGKVVTSIEGHAYGKGSMNAHASNNNLSETSALILKNTLFALASHEFFGNEKSEIYANDVRVKDIRTGKEFSFNLTGKEI